MKLIKFFSLIFSFLFLTSCNTDYLNVNNENSTNLNISSNEIFNISTKGLTLPKFKSLNDDELLDIYAIDPNILVDYISNISQENTSGVEISIFHLKDKANANEVILGIQRRIEILENEFKNVKQSEYELIKNPYLNTLGNYVIFALHRDIKTFGNNLNNIFRIN